MGPYKKFAAKKRKLEEKAKPKVEPEEVPATRPSDQEPPEKKIKWTNKTRTLVLIGRGINYRARHLKDDLKCMMPHSKTDSKLNSHTRLFDINEMAEMKNCDKCLYFEGRKKKDTFMWAANVARGPSVKFEVENIHTLSELKMTGNCLKGSRPLLSFDKTFEKVLHFKIIKELFVQIFGIPDHHPKSQPFFDKVFTFTVVDGKIWFRNFQMIDENGALTEIGPRMVLNPVKLFEGSFSGQTMWENPKYVTPNTKRQMLKKAASMKYRQRIEDRAVYKATRPTGPTVKVDETEEVFKTTEFNESESSEED